MEYKIIKSWRKTISMEIKHGELIVRAPYYAGRREIESFVTKHRRWIERHMTDARAAEEKRQSFPKFTEKEIRALTEDAKRVIPPRVEYYAGLIGVKYGRITIRHQKTRWGSCSAKGNLNFNCLLMLAPPEVLDSVVVHELCHRKQMNHSKRFYGEVLRVFPEYRKWHKWLKVNGPELLARLG